MIPGKARQATRKGEEVDKGLSRKPDGPVQEVQPLQGPGWLSWLPVRRYSNSALEPGEEWRGREVAGLQTSFRSKSDRA